MASYRVKRSGERNLRLREGFRIKHDVFDTLALPGIGSVHEAVAGLDDGGVGILARLAFQRNDVAPGLAVGGHRNLQWRSSAGGGIVNQ